MSDDSSPANAGVHYPPPLLYVAGIAGGWLAQRAHPLEITGHPSPVRTSLAVVFALGWLVTFAAASGAFARHRTTLIPNRPAAALVTSGIYRYTRNPMYVSLVLLYLAVTLVLDSWWPLITGMSAGKPNHSRVRRATSASISTTSVAMPCRFWNERGTPPTPRPMQSARVAAGRTAGR